MYLTLDIYATESTFSLLSPLLFHFDNIKNFFQFLIHDRRLLFNITMHVRINYTDHFNLCRFSGSVYTTAKEQSIL